MTQPHSDSIDRYLADRFTQHHDEFAFRVLYRLHTPLLYRFARRVLGPREQAAADVVQDSWLRAAQRFSTFRWESSLATWLVGIVINRCREELRQARTCPTRSSEDPPAAGTAAAEQIDLERAIAQLPDGYREVLVLHDIEGYTHEEIARLLDIEPSTSKSQLSRARQSVRTWLANRDERRTP